MNANDTKGVEDDDFSVKTIRKILEKNEERSTARSVLEVILMIFVPAVAGLICASLGSWLFSLNEQNQVYVFCAIAIAYSISDHRRIINAPEYHIATALKALALAVVRLK
jgi:hypothetical protein